MDIIWWIIILADSNTSKIVSCLGTDHNWWSKYLKWLREVTTVENTNIVPFFLVSVSALVWIYANSINRCENFMPWNMTGTTLVLNWASTVVLYIKINMRFCFFFIKKVLFYINHLLFHFMWLLIFYSWSYFLVYLC